jgi:hypothetical protein
VRKSLDDLQTGIEASIGGQLDVATLIDSAMLLTNLEMQPPPPGVGDDQEQQVGLKNPPPGVERAEIWISPPSGENGFRSLSLRVQLQRQIRPYVVAGTPGAVPRSTSRSSPTRTAPSSSAGSSRGSRFHRAGKRPK